MSSFHLHIALHLVIPFSLSQDRLGVMFVSQQAIVVR